MASALSSFKVGKYAGHEPLSFNDSHGARPSRTVFVLSFSRELRLLYSFAQELAFCAFLGRVRPAHL